MKIPYDTSKWPLQAFILSKELFDATSFEEVDATFQDMLAAEIAKPPYDHFDIIVPVSKVIHLIDKKDTFIKMAEDVPGETLRIRYTRIPTDDPKDINFEYTWIFSTPKFTINFVDYVRMRLQLDGSWEKLKEYHTHTWKFGGRSAYKLLLVMLATRNAVKTTKERKLMKFGIGGKNKNRYTTTITIGKITEHSDPSKPTGIKRRPHLRRGHVRNQHYGPRNELVKQIFIEPIFVNADEGWIAERSAYNLIKEHKDEETEE